MGATAAAVGRRWHQSGATVTPLPVKQVDGLSYSYSLAQLAASAYHLITGKVSHVVVPLLELS
jgi:hypothetical protein